MNADIIELEKELLLAQQSEDTSKQITILSDMGILLQTQGQFSKSMEKYEQSKRIAEKVCDAEGQFDACNNLEQAGDLSMQCSQLVNVGNLYNTLRQSAAAIKVLEQALDMAQRCKLTKLQGAACLGLGRALETMLEEDEGLLMIEKSVHISEQGHDTEGYAASCRALADAYADRGKHSKAVELYEKVINIHVNSGNKVHEYRALHQLSCSLFREGHSARAARELSRALSLMEQVEQELGGEDALRISLFERQQVSFVLLIQILLDLGEPQHALGIAELSKARSLSFLMRSGQEDVDERGGGCWDLGLDEQASGLGTDVCVQSLEPDEPMGAREWRRVQEMAREEGCRIVEYFFLNEERLLMWVVSEDGELLCFQNVVCSEVLRRQRGVEPRELELTVTGCVLEGALGGLMELFWASMDVDGRDAAGAGSGTASGSKEGVDGTGSVDGHCEETVKEVCTEEEDGVAVAAERDDGSESDEEDGELRGGPWKMSRAEIARKERALVTVWLMGQGKTGGAGVDGVREAWASLRGKVTTWRDLRRVSDKVLKETYGVEKPGARTAILQRIRALFDQTELLSSLHAVLILPITDHILAPPRKLHSRIAEGATPHGNAQAQNCDGREDQGLDAKGSLQECDALEPEVLIIPHRDLFVVPWAALAPASSSTPLIARVPIRTAPSLRVARAAARAVERGEHAAGSGGERAVGGMFGGGGSGEGLQEEEGGGVRARKRARRAVQSAECENGMCAVVVGNPLPTVESALGHAEEEARATAALVGGRALSSAEVRELEESEAVTMERREQSRRGTMEKGEGEGEGAERAAGRLERVRVLLRGSASTIRVCEALQGAAWAHLACHADLGTRSLLLADSGRARSGEWKVGEVQSSVRLRSGATLVLSACSSGRGEVLAEGVVGLQRAFFAAGASAVVASLWSVGDQSSEVWMRGLYSHLRRGLRVPQAMRCAMMDMMEREGAGELRGRRSVVVESEQPPRARVWQWAPFFVSGASTCLPSPLGR